MASDPISTRPLPFSTPLRMVLAASIGVVLASLASKNFATSAWSKFSATVALRAMAVLMPPGCTTVTFTGAFEISISMRSDSLNPRTANFAALYADCDGMASKPKRLEMLMMWPSPEAWMCGRNAWCR